MMVRVDQQIDLATADHRLESVEEHLRRVGELAVDDDHRVGPDHPAHRAAARRERAHVAAQGREHGNGRRLLERPRRLLSEQPG